ncbi:LysR family transcriptional regulator [Leekyejoonella antrihumi]|uniref:LysR family transcriptional regulator n=1 Tax=Leekyejoonella antrihumi TaxID=1660198 RepID=A0A563E7Z8_9MICO|nr:LysR family transcriptional regulator [Leekyejoonella antrihumi]TWP38321.1 LysR family transcriptional regulator [Leekyejoonella antrihumi]
MELRQLEAFVVVATELHFSRAAEKLTIGQPTLSDLIRRLERELGTPLFIRTTRRAVLTEAGAELLKLSTRILADVAAASYAVSRIAHGDEGTVRVGMTPPVAPVLAPALTDGFSDANPGIVVAFTQLWLPALLHAVVEGTVDVAITCGLLKQSDGLTTELLCSQPLLVGLRRDHRLADHEAVRLADLADDRLGTTAESLFPAWALAQRQALATAGISPSEVPLAMTELAANRWQDQPEVDWIMLIESLIPGHPDTVIRPVTPQLDVPFTLQWNAGGMRSPAVARFVRHALTADLPPGWTTGPTRHQLET